MRGPSSHVRTRADEVWIRVVSSSRRRKLCLWDSSAARRGWAAGGEGVTEVGELRAAGRGPTAIASAKAAVIQVRIREASFSLW